MEETKKVLECKNLCKKIGKKQILKNVSLEINEGDILGFIGPNGAGKTTTIKLVLGLQKITSGTVKINGYDIKENFEKSIDRVGAIIENPDLYMYMSGKRNLKMIAKLYKNVDDNRIDKVIKLVGLENRINDKVSKYSLGMRQRLGIAQAILHRPNLLILDEPTNGLDPEGIKSLRDLLTNLANKEHMGILISSHNLSELENFCNKVTIIQNGEIIESSSIEDAKRVNGKELYDFEINDTMEIQEIFKSQKYDIEIENKTTFKVYVTKEEIPSIVETLVKNNIKIYKVNESTTSLEDAFLKKTGGNVIE